MRISNVKPAHVEWYIYTHSTAVPLMTITMTITLTLTLTLTKTYSDIYIYAKTVHPLLGIHLIIYIKGIIAAGRYKINPRRRLCCITAVLGFKVAKFDLHRQVTFENVLSRLGVQLPSGLVPSMLFICPPTAWGRLYCSCLVAIARYLGAHNDAIFGCKDKHYFWTSKDFFEKIPFLAENSWFRR